MSTLFPNSTTRHPRDKKCVSVNLGYPFNYCDCEHCKMKKTAFFSTSTITFKNVDFAKD